MTVYNFKTFRHTFARENQRGHASTAPVNRTTKHGPCPAASRRTGTLGSSIGVEGSGGCEDEDAEKISQELWEQRRRLHLPTSHILGASPPLPSLCRPHRPLATTQSERECASRDPLSQCDFVSLSLPGVLLIAASCQDVLRAIRKFKPRDCQVCCHHHRRSAELNK